MKRLKFISYDGKYPNLCSGTLIIELDGKRITFPEYCLHSGGSAWIDDHCDEHVELGEWRINKYTENFPSELMETLTKLVNDNIHEGCCGGCI